MIKFVTMVSGRQRQSFFFLLVIVKYFKTKKIKEIVDEAFEQARNRDLV